MTLRKMGPSELVGSFVVFTLVVHLVVVGSHHRLLQAHSSFAINDDVPVVDSRDMVGDSTRKLLQSFATSPSENKQEEDGPKIVWLMSFPNSGTSFTSRLVRDASMTTSASNYGDETPSGMQGEKEAVFTDQPQGPFWIKPEDSPDFSIPANYILTKTHCGMRCTLCPPEKYGESTYSFRRRCLTTKWMEVQPDGSKRRTFSEYKPDRIGKAVHLIRDPFDNIVSRFHLEQQIEGRTAKNFDVTRAGFRDYCKSVDTLHSESEKRVAFLDEDLLKLLRKVPCHEDFVRYIEWHNLAFTTGDDFGLETYVLHYDWFTTRYNRTAAELLDFLELDQRAEPTPFTPGRSYDYFTPKEKATVMEAFRMMASTQTWPHVAQYFFEAQQHQQQVGGILIASAE